MVFWRLCVDKTDDVSWSEESADKDDEDWLLRKLSAALQDEHRKVRFDPYLDENELLKLIDDELYVRPQTDLQSRPDEFVDDYASRLRRFLSNINYFLDSWHYDDQRRKHCFKWTAWNH